MKPQINDTVITSLGSKGVVTWVSDHGKFYSTDGSAALKFAYDIRAIARHQAVREVSRPAEVGEWIKIVESHDSRYKNGDIFNVISGGYVGEGNAWIYSQVYERMLVCPFEYVVLEGYKPQEVK